MNYTIVGEGNSNVVIRLGREYPHRLIRVCKRHSKVSKNNAYLYQNESFQKQFRDEFKEIAKNIDEIEYKKIWQSTGDDLLRVISKILIERNVNIDDDCIVIMIIKNYLDFTINIKTSIDYYTTIYNDRIIEFKPKWGKMSLDEYKKFIDYPHHDINDQNVPFCRNCQYIDVRKHREFCYNGCKSNDVLLPFKKFYQYLENPDNIIQKIYKTQLLLQEEIVNSHDPSLFHINSLIALRDVSIFHDMNTQKDRIIDIDYKDIDTIDAFQAKIHKERKLLNNIL